ncbi:hypothetical protein RRF57_001735 [Xylaria bambusicola]|uniref:Heterokaryon incompatibility domain-containing protein n=1 Tax=Xylaria bambusicola TaxID=326684 RepID=A0AAN7UBZ9_9PEZI
MAFHPSLYGPRQHNFPGVRLYILQQTRMEYQYTPLGDGEIRLIELRPACDGPKLFVSFNHVSINDAANTYEALSYTWGSSAKPNILLCGNSYLQITASLQSALMNLRLDSTPRMLWVDAICINQGDLLERGTQVVLMEQIYRKASKTVVYLGDESVDSNLAARYLETHFWRVRCAMADFINQRRVAEDAGDMLQICIKSLGTSQAKLFEGFDQSAVQEAIVNLLCRPWFQRIWVIQEFVVSPKVDMYCGKTLCEWGSFSMMFYYSFVEAGVSWDHIIPREKKINFFRGLTQIMQMHELRNNFHGTDESKTKSGLIRLLSRCRTADATLPIDKIFALLNLSSAAQTPMPDYLKSKADVYREFAELALENGEGRSILSEAALTHRKDPNLPSWVPDWSEPPVRIDLGQILIASNNLFFNAAGSQKDSQERPKPRMRIEGNTLFVKGLILQSIAIVGPDRPVPGTNIIEAPNLTNFMTILSYIQMFMGMESPYPTGEEKDVVAGILLEANQQKSPRKVTSFWENTQARDLLFEPELSALRPEANIIGEEMRRRRLDDPQGYANMCRAIAGRRFAITDQEYVGLVPDTAKDGDVICIMQGFNVPYVLRQIGDHYIFLGDAYVHGIMMGEAFQRDDSLSECMTEIAIR